MESYDDIPYLLTKLGGYKLQVLRAIVVFRVFIVMEALIQRSLDVTPVFTSHDGLSEIGWSMLQSHDKKPWFLHVFSTETDLKDFSKVFISKWDISQRKSIWRESLQDIYFKHISNFEKTTSKSTIDGEYHEVLKELVKDVTSLINESKASSLSASSSSSSSMQEFFGSNILQIDFTDVSSFGGESEGPNNSFIHQESTAIIVFDRGLLCFNYIASSSLWISSSSDLNGKSPTYCRFIRSNILAIGCNDGNIRIYDFVSSKVVKTLVSTHGSRTDILHLLNLPPKLAKDADIYRFLSLGSDGNGFVWEVQVVGNMVIHDSPIGRLQTGLASGRAAFLGTGNNVFIDEESNALVVVSGDRSLRSWSLENLNLMSRKDNKVGSLRTLSLLDRVKPARSVASFSSLAPIYHPRFTALSSTYILALGSSESDSLGIAQAAETLPGEEASERSSINISTSNTANPSSDPNIRLHLLHDFSLNRLMVRHRFSLYLSVMMMIERPTQG